MQFSIWAKRAPTSDLNSGLIGGVLLTPEIIKLTANTAIGKYMGRVISQMPFYSMVGSLFITFISAFAEIYVVNKYLPNESHGKTLTNVLVRVIVGSGVFAAGAAVMGGNILPALATGALVGGCVYGASKLGQLIGKAIWVAIMMIGVGVYLSPMVKNSNLD